MGALDSLVNKQAPKAFAGIAAKHNRLVELIELMQGDPSIDVTVTEGKIKISINPDSPIGSGTGVASELHYDDGSTTIDIDGNGVQITKSGFTTIIAETGFSIEDAAGNTAAVQNGVVQLHSGDNDASISIDYSLLTQDMGIKEIDVCVDGSPKKMLVIGSEPYDP